MVTTLAHSSPERWCSRIVKRTWLPGDGGVEERTDAVGPVVAGTGLVEHRGAHRVLDHAVGREQGDPPLAVAGLDGGDGLL